MTIDQLKEELRTSTYEEAIEALTEYITGHPEEEEAYIARGLKHWGAGKRSLAINDYLSAIRLNPESRARQALDAANSILDYRNTDLYNP